MYMKPVQVLFDEDLLAELDTDSDVRKHGRSKVLRGLVASYLEDQHRAMVDAQYAAGYGAEAQVHEELAGWDEEGEWPDD
jgi:metal-responsive CopG/Arc/MetJ family transcriptional regulator